MKRASGQRGGLILLLLVCLAAFSPSLFNGFVYDDFRFIERNPFMDGPLDLKAVLLNPETMEQAPNRDIYRPMRTLFFHVEHRLGGGKPFLHHLVGLLLHACNTLLVFLLIRKIRPTRSSDDHTGTFALFGAALFALHPVQVESVAWISSRGDVLVAFFVLLALLNSLQKVGTGFLLRAGFTFMATFLACLAKESGVITCGFILLAGLIIVPFRHRATFAHALASLAAAGLYLALRSHVIGGMPGQVAPHGGSPWTNFFYACFGMGYQVSLIFRPWFQNVDYQGSFFLAVPYGGVVVVGVLYLGLQASALFTARRLPLYAFAVLFAGIALFPTSSLIKTLRSLVNDRYLYLAMAAAALLLAAVLHAQENRSRKAAVVARWICMLLLAALAGLSFNRCFDWRDEFALWTSTVATNPGSIRARTGLSSALFNRGDTDGALREAEKGISMAPPGTSLSADAYLLAAMALKKKGRDDQAAQYLRFAMTQGDRGGRVQTFRSRFLEICGNLWSFDMEASRFGEALAAAMMLVKYGGETPQYLLVLAQTYRALGNVKEWEEALMKAEALGSPGTGIYQALYELYMLTNRPTQAQEVLEKLKRIRQADSELTGK